MPDPCGVTVVLKLSAYLGEHGLRMLVTEAFGLGRDYNEIDVRPREAKLSCMRSVDFHIACGYGFFDDLRNVLYQLLLYRPELLQDVSH